MQTNHTQMETSAATCTKHFLQLIFLSCLIFLSPILISCSNVNDNAVGYGYSVQSVSGSGNGHTLTANLQLINNSSVFGQDIQHLTLTAWYVHHIISLYCRTIELCILHCCCTSRIGFRDFDCTIVFTSCTSSYFMMSLEKFTWSTNRVIFCVVAFLITQLGNK